MKQIQQFLKDPQNPREKVEIKVRLKNSGKYSLSIVYFFNKQRGLMVLLWFNHDSLFLKFP